MHSYMMMINILNDCAIQQKNDKMGVVKRLPKDGPPTGGSRVH